MSAVSCCSDDRHSMSSRNKDNKSPQAGNQKDPFLLGKTQGACNKPNKQCHTGEEFIRNGKRYIRLISNNMVRDLLIPSKEENINSIVLPEEKYSKIEKLALSPVNKNELFELRMQERKRLEKECKARAEKCKIQHPPRRDPRIDNLIAKQLKDAKEQRLECEDDVKKVNSLLLEAQCNTIRDLQIKEKEFMREMKEKEKRSMMDLIDRQTVEAAKRVQMESEESNRKKREFVRGLDCQIKERQAELNFANYLAFKERTQNNEAFIQIEIDELEEHKKMLEEKAAKHAEINKINAALQVCRDFVKADDWVEDQKIVSHLKKVEERTLRYEQEKEKTKADREKVISEMRDKQKAALDKKALKEKLDELRVEQKAAAAWMDQAKDEQLKKIKDINAFRAGVDKQLQEKAIFRVKEIERNREEYIMTLKARNELLQKDQELEKRRILVNEEWKQQLLAQIKEGKTAKIEDRKSKYKEGQLIWAQDTSKKEEIAEYIKKKLLNAKSHNIGDGYVKHIEREMNIKK